MCGTKFKRIFNRHSIEFGSLDNRINAPIWHKQEWVLHIIALADYSLEVVSIGEKTERVPASAIDLPPMGCQSDRGCAFYN
jgi:hypothetical protein